MNWTAYIDYYFLNNTGLLLAEKLYIHRFEFYQNDPSVEKNQQDFYIYRTLASINGVNLLVYKPPPNVRLIYIISFVVAIPTVFLIMLCIWKKYRKSKNLRSLTVESNS